MDLYVIRHAIAVPSSASVRDDTRPLTPEGRERFAYAVRGLQRLGIEFDRLYHSPWLRAVETAELLTPLLRGESAVHPGLATAPTREFLASLRGESIAVVGHEPWLTQLVSLLACDTPAFGKRIELKKGGCIWLTGKARAGAMHMRAHLPPRVLRRIDKGDR